eukprot:13737081-Ditylum_brightwellii.AAC.1
MEQEIEDVNEQKMEEDKPMAEENKPKMEEDEPKMEENEPKKEEIIEKNEESDMVNLDTFETGVITVEEVNNTVNNDVIKDD